MDRQVTMKNVREKKITRGYLVNEICYSTGERRILLAENNLRNPTLQTNLIKKKLTPHFKVMGMRRLGTTEDASRIFSSKDWDTFFQLTDNPPEPARALREAYRTYKEQFDSEE